MRRALWPTGVTALLLALLPFPGAGGLAQATCSYSASPPAFTAAPGGSTFTFDVTTDSGCFWSLLSDAGWLTATGPLGNYGYGSGSVNGIARANSTGLPRIGVVHVRTSAGVEVASCTVTQPPCTFVPQPGSAIAEPGGSLLNWTVVAEGGCGWSLAASHSWLTASVYPYGTTGSGTQPATCRVQANTTGTARAGDIWILNAAGNQEAAYHVTQSACQFIASPNSFVVPPNGEILGFDVTAAVGCSWRLVADGNWFSVLSPPGGAGSGAGYVTCAVTANHTNRRRLGSLRLNDADGDLAGLVTISQDACVETPAGCPAPKAYVVAARHPVDPYNFEQLFEAAAHLRARGWTAVQLFEPDVNDLCAMLQADPCARGLYIVGHGAWNQTGPGQVVFAIRGDPDGIDVSPGALADCLGPGVHLDFLTVIACFVDPDDWESAFPHPYFRGPSHSYWFGLTLADQNQFDEELLGGGLTLRTCQGAPHGPVAPVELAADFPRQAPADTMACPSFAIVDSIWTGEDLYPTLGCARALVPAGPTPVTLHEPGGAFDVAFHFPAGYSDSVGVVATLFARVPPTCDPGGLRHAGRSLLFAAVTGDTAVPADSMRVVMRYDPAELAAAGITDPAGLMVYWIGETQDSGRFLSCDIDTLLHRVEFTSRFGGIAGLYGSAVSAAADLRPPEEALLQLLPPGPNPAAGPVALQFRLSQAGPARVLVYDILGREVARLIDGFQPAGWHSLTWEPASGSGPRLPGGIYFVQLSAGGHCVTRRAVLAR